MDTTALTVTYYDKAGNQLFLEKISWPACRDGARQLAGSAGPPREMYGPTAAAWRMTRAGPRGAQMVRSGGG